MPSSHTGQQQFGRLSDFPGLDHESLADMPTGDMWEPQRGGFPNVPVDSAFRHHGRQDSFWADPADMAGQASTVTGPSIVHADSYSDRTVGLNPDTPHEADLARVSSPPAQMLKFGCSWSTLSTTL